VSNAASQPPIVAGRDDTSDGGEAVRKLPGLAP